jgi:DNA invertase Pin-like site-specific DNA recombinase
MIQAAKELEILDLLEEGVTPQDVIRRTGIPKTTVYRIRDAGGERPRGPGSQSALRKVAVWRRRRLQARRLSNLPGSGNPANSA